MKPIFAFLVLLVALSNVTVSIAQDDLESVVSLLEFVIDVDEETAAKCLATLRTRVQSGEVAGAHLTAIREQLNDKLSIVLAANQKSTLYFDALMLATSWGDSNAARRARLIIKDPAQNLASRLEAISSLTAARDDEFLRSVKQILSSQQIEPAVKSRVIGAIGRYDDPTVATIVLDLYGNLPADLQPQAIELLTQRSTWSKQLLSAIGEQQLPASVLNVNQVRSLLSNSDQQLVAMVKSQWGAVRTERNPQREQVIRQMYKQLSQAVGDPIQGRAVFNRVCGQCHRIYGIGQDVGPEITRNGRGSFEHLLSNVFDPSLVIGASYQARTVITADGRVLTGLLAEDNEQRIVLKTQGGKQEIIPREDVEEVAISKLSLMPEGLEKQLTSQQLADLFAFLALDRAPEDADGLPIAGTPSGLIKAN